MAGDENFDDFYANTYTEDDRRAFENQPTSQKRFLIAWVLALFLGPVGAHRYYLGHYPSAVLKTVLPLAAAALLVAGPSSIGLALVGAVVAWMIIDLLLLLTGTTRDRADHRLAGFSQFAGRCAAMTVLVLAGLLVVALVVGTSTGVSG